jgi:transcriptional regulator with XRE-family HTH domain
MGGRSERSGRFVEVREPDPGPFKVRFGELVRNVRVRNGLTQTDVARLAFNDEEAKSRVSDVERGRNEPQADTIHRFCEALKIPYADVEALRASKAAVRTDLPEGPLVHIDIRPVPGFAGREDLLDAIDKALRQSGGGTAALTDIGAGTPEANKQAFPTAGQPPLPWGEGGGEGLRTIGEALPPHPSPLPTGEGTGRAR